MHTYLWNGWHTYVLSTTRIYPLDFLIHKGQDTLSPATHSRAILQSFFKKCPTWKPWLILSKQQAVHFWQHDQLQIEDTFSNFMMEIDSLVWNMESNELILINWEKLFIGYFLFWNPCSSFWYVSSFRFHLETHQHLAPDQTRTMLM